MEKGLSKVRLGVFMLRQRAGWMLMVLALALPALADSHVRIVRLSNVEGNVQMDRNTGQGFEKAFLNMPVVQGAILSTMNDARAEVEFEDGTTLRLTPNSTLEFAELALRDSGARASTLTLKTGQMYINYRGAKNEEFTLLFAGEKVKLAEEAHLRIDLEDTNAEIAVFKGNVSVEGSSGTAEVAKGKTATFDLAEAGKFTIAKNIEEDPYDSWDKQQAKYHDEYARNGANGNYPYGYGVSDLNYYGSYYNVPGYGTMWQPYFAGAGWNPFSDGAWMFYPGIGYTWVSAYPWGWMPYMYGGWSMVPGYGWMWAPGGWGGWNTVPVVTNPPNRFTKPQPPVRGTTTVMVGQGMTAMAAAPPRRVLVQSGSAGLGVPRGVNNLQKVSRQVERSGFATVHSAPPARSAWASPSWGGNSSGSASRGSMNSGSMHGTNSGSSMHSAPPMRSGGGSMSGGHASAPHR
jgi:hypothetical protein